MKQRLPHPLSVDLRLQQPGLDVRAQFRVLPGKVCALVGRPGAGKSALLKAIAGLYPTLGGRVAIGSHCVYDASAGLHEPPHRRQIAWLDASSHLFPHMSVKGNLGYGMAQLPADHPAPDVDAMVHWLDLVSLLDAMPARLSIAQRTRVALGRLLLAAPRAIVLDDPLGHVPADEREALLDLLAQLPTRAKVPVVFTSPRMHEVVRMADELILMHEGRVTSVGSVPHIMADVSLSTWLEGQHAGSILEGEVKQHDLDWLLSEIDVCGQRVTVPAILHGVGRKVRLKVRARDVTVHREPDANPGASNQLRGRITQIMLAGTHGSYGAVSIELARLHDAQPAFIDAHHDHPDPVSAPASMQMWALLTRRSIQEMNWEPGDACVASFKAMAVTVTGWR